MGNSDPVQERYLAPESKIKATVHRRVVLKETAVVG